MSCAADTSSQATASFGTSRFAYAGEGLRAKKIENGSATYYLRSAALGGQVVCEINSTGKISSTGRQTL